MHGSDAWACCHPCFTTAICAAIRRVVTQTGSLRALTLCSARRCVIGPVLAGLERWSFWWRGPRLVRSESSPGPLTAMIVMTRTTLVFLFPCRAHRSSSCGGQGRPPSAVNECCEVHEQTGVMGEEGAASGEIPRALRLNFTSSSDLTPPLHLTCPQAAQKTRRSYRRPMSVPKISLRCMDLYKHWAHRTSARHVKPL